MSEINLPQNFADNPSAALNAGNIILSYMVHPNDEQKRDKFLKLSNLDIKHRLQDEPISKALSDQAPIFGKNSQKSSDRNYCRTISNTAGKRREIFNEYKC
jgi:hypothetical protein